MDTELVIRYLLSALFSIFITALIFNFVFSVTAFKKHTKAQTALLSKIAEKQGVSEKEIKDITDNLK